MKGLICILGAGGWGTTLAVYLSSRGERVKLWEVFPEYAQVLQEKRENIKFLPGVCIPEAVEITSSLGEAVKDVDLIVVAIPSQFVRGVIHQLNKFELECPVLSVSKGIENGTLKRISEIIDEELNPTKIGVLSGPSHAEEVSRGVPTTLVASSPDDEFAEYIQERFNSEKLRVYTNPDMVGVELGGALKNIVALACGISDGLGFGDNTKAALMTRGLAEIRRLGVKMGANPHTFSGLSGMGDLITTCISNYSRNRRVGLEIGKGKTLSQVLKSMAMVAEGVPTTKSAKALSERYRVDMPITREVYAVLFEGKNPRKAVADLMMRTAKPELREKFIEFN